MPYARRHTLTALALAGAAALSLAGVEAGPGRVSQAAANQSAPVCAANVVSVDFTGYWPGTPYTRDWVLQADSRLYAGAFRFTGPRATLTVGIGTPASRVEVWVEGRSVGVTTACAPLAAPPATDTPAPNPGPSATPPPPPIDVTTGRPRIPTIRVELPPKPDRPRARQPRCVARPGGFAILVRKRTEAGTVRLVWTCRYTPRRVKPPAVAGEYRPAR